MFVFDPAAMYTITVDPGLKPADVITQPFTTLTPRDAFATLRIEGVMRSGICTCPEHYRHNASDSARKPFHIQCDACCSRGTSAYAARSRHRTVKVQVILCPVSRNPAEVRGS